MSNYLKGRNASHTYLRRFFAETSKVDRAETFETRGIKDSVISVAMTYGAVIEALEAAPVREQKAAADMIRRIDFVNGDICDYLRHLGACLAQVQADALGY